MKTRNLETLAKTRSITTHAVAPQVPPIQAAHRLERLTIHMCHHSMYNMSTATLRQLRHDFASVEAAAQKAPVTITRRGKVIGVFSARGKGKWRAPDFAARAKADFGTRFSSLVLVNQLADGGER